MTQTRFLGLAALVAVAVGLFALILPEALLASKGVADAPGTRIWVRETGVALIAIGVMAMWVRHQPDSPTMRAFLSGNLLLQIGLFLCEAIAYAQGVITQASGVVPNLCLHLLLASGFLYFISKQARRSPGSPASHSSSGNS